MLCAVVHLSLLTCFPYLLGSSKIHYHLILSLFCSVVEQLCWKEELHHVCVSYGSEPSLGKLHKVHLESSSLSLLWSFSFTEKIPSRLEFFVFFLLNADTCHSL